MSGRDDERDQPSWDDEPALLAELGDALTDDPGAEPSPERVQAVREAAVALRGGRTTASATRHERWGSRRRALLGGSVAAGFGGIAGWLLHDVGAEEPAASRVPLEAIAFTGDAATVSTSALINHTWGTELVLDLSGLAPGRAYQVVFETPAGDVPAGSLLAVPDVVMKCRFNAAPLRADVTAIEVRSPAGEPVLRSDLPSVAT